MNWETAIVAVIGIVATIVVSRYYFRRSTEKRLSVFSLLESQVFRGIEPNVRKELNFTFHGNVVQDLSEIGLLVANTGERAISGFIEPLTLDLPADAKVLDASIDYRHPEDLRAALRTEGLPHSHQTVAFDLPLLNKGEYFAVRLLIDGAVESEDLTFRLLADDLPRQIKVDPLQYEDTAEKRSGVDWSAVAVGALVFGLAACVGYSLWLLRGAQPDLFILPWATFHPSLGSVTVHAAVGLVALVALLGGALVIGAGFGAAMSGRPRFPLPSYVGRRPAFPFDMFEDELRRISPQASGSPEASKQRRERVTHQPRDKG